MKKFLRLFFAVFVMAAMVSCTGENRRNRETPPTRLVEHPATETVCTSERQRPAWLVYPPMGSTSEQSLDFFGTYEGVLPAASGMGIVTIVTLNEDRTFEMTRTYLRGDGGEEFMYEGSYTIEFGQIVVLDLGNGNEMFLDLREGALALLDNQMNRIGEDMWDPRYLLMMVDSGIYWH